jgi:TPR repeat protein
MRRMTTFVLVFFLASAALAQNPTLGTDAPRIFEKGMNALMGVGVTADDLDALEYLRRSADLGYAPAQVVVGSFYDTGTKVPQSYTTAADWYKKATKQDDRVAEWLLGRLYYSGLGVQRDLAAAETWLQKSARQGDPYGQYLLGMVKVEQSDYVKAADLFRKSANQGLPQAQAQFGRLLKNGQGVTGDKNQAYVWLLLSYQAGYQEAAGDLQLLNADLTMNQIDEAKNKARDLQQTVTRAAVARGCTGWPGEFDQIPAPPTPEIQNFCR